MRLRCAAFFTLVVGCRPEPASTTNVASEAVAPAPITAAKVNVPAPDPGEAQLPDHGVAMRVPEGWATKRGKNWVLVREPTNAAGYLLYGVMDIANEAPEMLHLAEKEFDASMPIGVGKVTEFGGGVRLAIVGAEVTRSDGTPLFAAMMTGGSPRHHPKGAIGIFAFWRSDSTPEQLKLIQDTLNSITAK